MLPKRELIFLMVATLLAKSTCTQQKLYFDVLAQFDVKQVTFLTNNSNFQKQGSKYLKINGKSHKILAFRIKSENVDENSISHWPGNVNSIDNEPHQQLI